MQRLTPWLGAHAGLALTILCLGVYLPGLWSISPIDRDESRFAQAGRQMFESAALPDDRLDPARHGGGLVVPMVQDRPRLTKPPLIYWLQSASAAIFTLGDPARDAIWMYRIPSVFAAIAAVLITWRLGRSMFDPRAAALGAAMLAVCPIVIFDAHQARADQLLLAATTLAMWGLWEWFKRGFRRGVLVLFAGVALGSLAKGPITPMVVALAAIAIALLARRRAGWALAVIALTAAAAIVALGPWSVAVASRVGWDVYLTTILDETIGRGLAAKEGHWAPPGYHTLFLLVLFWPGILLTGLGLERAWTLARGGRARDAGGRPARRRFAPWSGRRAELFCLAWIIPSWLVFELAATKLPHYTLPLYPPIALLTARATLAAAAGSLPKAANVGAKIGTWLWLIGGLAIAGAIAAGLVLIPLDWFPRAPHVPWVRTAAAAALLIAGVYFVVRAGRLALAAFWSRAALTSILAAALLGASAMAGVVPALTGLSPKVARLIRLADPGATRPVAAAGYHEDSLIFLTRARIERINPTEAREWIAAHPDGIIVMRDADFAGIPELHGAFSGEVRGFNLGRSSVEHLRIIDLSRPRPPSTHDAPTR